MLARPLVLGALALAATAGAAQADPTCTTEPRAKWMAESAFKEMAVKEHKISEVRKFEVTDTNCYEIYGFRDGKQVEIYFNPVDGKVVQEGD